jgi:hypothetical protein
MDAVMDRIGGVALEELGAREGREQEPSPPPCGT